MIADRGPRLHLPAQLQFAVPLGVAVVLLFMGGLLVLVAVGLAESEEPVEPLGRVVAFLFGGVLAGVGVFVARMLLRPLAQAAGADDWSSTWRLALKRLVCRTDHQSLFGAALPRGAQCARLRARAE